MRTRGWGAFSEQFKNLVLGCWAATFRQAVCIRTLVVNTTSAPSWATSSSTCSASTSGSTFSREERITRSPKVLARASRPFSWARTQALASSLYSWMKLTRSSLGRVKMFSLESPDSGFARGLAASVWGSSTTSTACSLVSTVISSHILDRFSLIWAGVASQASV